MRTLPALTLTATLLATAASAQPAPKAPKPSTEPRKYLRQRLGSLGIAQLYAPGLAELTPRERLLAWHLTLAGHAGEDIAYDQLGWNNVAVKRLLEGVYLFGLEGKPVRGGFDEKLVSFLTRFYSEQGNHESNTTQKFLPEFTPEQLAAAARRAFDAGAPFGVKDAAALDAWLTELRPTLFDPAHEPQLTAKTPPPGKDLLTASSNTAYGRDVTLADLKGFTEKNPLNSRVVKQNGKLVEQVFRAGTPDRKVPAGLYAAELSRVNEHLTNALAYAAPDQKAALEKLIRFFQTGDLKDWDAYNIAWLKANPTVDANIGFIESYVDARGQKGQWEALINYKDPHENAVMELLGKRAQYFEDRMPWPEQYRRKEIALPVSKSIALVSGYAEPPAGINLPNEQPIREKYGSKSVLVSNTMETAYELVRLPLSLEFLPTAKERDLAKKYGASARKLLVALHEVTGHASGKVDASLKGGPDDHLKEYANTLEEARADLVALHHAFDPALAELNKDHTTVAEVMVRDFLVEGLTNLRKVESGSAYEEDHQRGHHMTVNYLVEKGAAKQVTDPKTKKTYWVETSIPKVREVVAELLSKLMVIKATGDYAAIKALVDEKGVKFDPKLRDQVVARVKAINVPSQTAMTYAHLSPVLDAKGAAVDVKVDHDQPFLDQHLERSLLGVLPAAEATRAAAKLTDGKALREALRARAVSPKADAGTP